MKKAVTILCAAFAATLLLVGSLSSAQTKTNAVPPRPTPQADKILILERAINALEAVKVELENPANSYGPEAHIALASCERTIPQLKVVLNYTKRPAPPK